MVIELSREVMMGFKSTGGPVQANMYLFVLSEAYPLFT